MYKIKGSLPILLLSLFTFTGCATTNSISADLRTQTYDAGYEQTFNAVVQTLSKEGYALDFSDQKSGVIDTDYQAASNILPSLSKNENIKINAILDKKSSGTQVQLTIDTQSMSTSTNGNSNNLSKEKAISYYKNLLMRIGDRL